MKDKAITPTRNERVMREDDFIVCKTDLKGRITYGNEIFIEYSGYSESELLGAQHNIIRHPDMPRGVFKFLWDNNYEWSRTGHLTVSKSVAASDKFTSLPFRKNIAEITSTGYSLPNSVVRQRAIETIVGEEISNMTLSKKSVADTAKSAEERVTKLLSSVK